MHLKHKGYYLGVLLIYTITTITLPSVGWCEPIYSPTPSSHSAPHGEKRRLLTKRGLTHPPNRGGGRKQLHLDFNQGGESTSLPYFHHQENRDSTQVETSGGRPEQALGPKMAPYSSSRSLKNREKPKQSKGGWMYPSLNPPNKVCSEGKINHVIHGKFYITGELEANVHNVGYQSDAAASGQERIRGQRVSGSEESWQRLQPVVECGDDAMTLTVRRRRAVQLLLDRVNESSVLLSQVPPQCGYSVQTTWRDLRFLAPYDACHVTQEGDSYVLPLLWRGTPVKMSCPVSHIQSQAVGSQSSPSLCCSQFGMTIKVQGLSSAEELRVNVRGEWTPVVVLAEQCGYTLDRRDAEIVIIAPFMTCGITVKDGKYRLSLQIGEQTFTLTCPVSPPEDVPLTPQPPVSSTHHPAEHVQEPLVPFRWAPPFYLAPPYYPHPIYHKYPSPEYDPPTPSSSPDPTFGPQPAPPDDSKPDYQVSYFHHNPVRESLPTTDDVEDSSQVYPDVHQTQQTPVLALSGKRSVTHSPLDSSFPIYAAAPSLQPPSHAFNQYYHYYHHPKIPLPDPPQDPDPDPEVPSVTNLQNPEFPVLPHSIRQSEALSRFNSEQVYKAATHPHTPPTTTAYPPRTYPYHYVYYFPHIARGEAKRLAPLRPDTDEKTDYHNTKLKAFVHQPPHSSEVHEEHNLHPHMEQPQPEKIINFKENKPKLIKHPLLSNGDDVKDELELPGPAPVAVPPAEQPSSSTPSLSHYLPPHQYYYHPYHFNQMHQQLSSDNHMSSKSSRADLDLLLQTSSSPPQPHTATPPTKSIEDVHYSPLHPYYYYYHLYHQPQVSVDHQEIHPASSTNSKSQSQLPEGFHSHMGRLTQGAEAQYPSMPQPRSFDSLDSHEITQHHAYDPFQHHYGEETEEKEDNGMKDQLKANPYTLPASPCGLGPLSDLECIVSAGCCSYPVKDCTVGQHLIFAVPDSVLEPTVAPVALPSAVSNLSCTLQRLTSDPDIYVVPLDGCGVNTHVFGQTLVHQLEVHGVHSLQDHSSVYENSPIRLMVECSSSPGSPGEVRLHVMDQPPPPVQSTPTVATVQLRIATDESFASFHPEAHLPLSVLRGRPVYVEVSLLDPPEPGLVLLVQSCLAYTQAPYSSWMLVYDSCRSHSDSQLLPSPHSDHIRRIVVSNFLFLSSENATYMTNGGHSHLEDTEIFFMCFTEVCSAADGDCTVGCINSPNSDV